MRYLGIDFGTKHVGVAVSDERGMIAFPKATFLNNGDLVSYIKELCEEYDVQKIVFGESRTVEGEENPVMKYAKEFADILEEKIKIEIVWEREDFTSAEVRDVQGNINAIDASAAALILQAYLDTQNNSL